ncbi:MAG TPA: response regulator transcription factor [Dehalococcoidales bacterium]
MKVLLVDDHSVMRDGIRALLSLQNDIEVVGEASEGREGIEKTRLLSPDVVVMDIAMPGMDGLEATRRITKRYLRTKVILVTQFDNKEHMLSAIKAGGVGYVPKRSLSSELILAIRTVSRGDSFLPPPATMALIKDYRQQSKSAGPSDQLTSMETEILKLVADGQTNQTIANLLAMTLRTVMGHRNRMMEKLGLKNRTELIKYAFRKGLASTN